MTRNGKLGTALAGAANWATQEGNGLTRPVIEAVTGIDARAHVPPFMETSLVNKAAALIPPPNPDGPAFGRKVVLYAGCHDNFNDGTPGEAAIKVLAHNGLQVRVEYPDCCGMPKFENGDLPAVASAAERISAFFAPLIEQGWDIVPLTTSCALMLKFEWPLIEPENAQRCAAGQAQLRCFRICRAPRQGLRPCPDRGHAQVDRRPFRLPRPRAEHGAQGDGNAQADPRGQAAARRALLGPRRQMGHLQGEFRPRASRSARRRART